MSGGFSEERKKKILQSMSSFLNLILEESPEFKRYAVTINFNGKRQGRNCTIRNIRMRLAEVNERTDGNAGTPSLSD